MVLGRPARAADILTWRDGSIRQLRNTWKAQNWRNQGFPKSCFRTGLLYYSFFQCFFELIQFIWASGGTWEARVSLRHTNLTRQIHPHDHECSESPPLKKSGFQKMDFGHRCHIIPFLLYHLFSMFFFWKHGSHMAPQAKPLCGNDS